MVARRIVLFVLPLSAGCGFISEEELASRFDQDGDTFNAIAYGGQDCDDTNRDVNPTAIEVCDGIDNDCDGDADSTALDLRTWYRDADEDGFGSPSSEEPALSCFPPEGYIGDATDCNDNPDQNGAAINPQTIWYRDNDGDGFGDPNDTITTCIQVPGLVAPKTNGEDDCDDTNPDLSPLTWWWEDLDGDGYGNQDAKVQGCWTQAPDGQVRAEEEAITDCDDDDATVFPGSASMEADLTLCTMDADGDGYGTAAPTDNRYGVGTDCDDVNAVVFPGSASLEDDPTLCTMDADGDLYGAATPSDERYAAGSDCDDTDADIHPNSLELWWDAVDNDCDGMVNTVSIIEAETYRDGLNLGDTLGKAVAAIGYFSFCNPADDTCTGSDHLRDFAVGAPGESSYSASNGAVYLIQDPHSDTPVAASYHGNSGINRLGIVIDAPGDLDADGLEDMLIGTQDDYAYVVFGTQRTDSARHTILGQDHHTKSVTVYVSESEGDQLGFAVAGVGLLTGDGTPDIAMGAHRSNATSDGGGRVYIFPKPDHHKTVDLNIVASGTWTVDEPVESPDDDTGLPDSWVDDSTVVEGEPPPVWTVDAEEFGESGHFGWAIAGIGDFDGDGASDLVIGAPGADFALEDAGRVYLLLGLPEGGGPGDGGGDDTGDADTGERVPSSALMEEGEPEETPDSRFQAGFSHEIFAENLLSVDGKFEGDRLGATVSHAGDVDGDGLSDIAVGAVGTPSVSSPGRVYVWFSTNGPITRDADLVIEPDDALGTGNFGYSVATAGPTQHLADGAVAGDLDGDGFGDLLIGSPEVADPGYDAGRVYLVYGGIEGTLNIADLAGALAGDGVTAAGAVFTGETPYQLGYAVAGVGDVTGDGNPDILLGAPGADRLATGAGAVFLLERPDAVE